MPPTYPPASPHTTTTHHKQRKASFLKKNKRKYTVDHTRNRGMMAQTLTGRAARLEDVAALAGVSLATASKALHNKPRISEETKRRVLSDGVRHDTWSMPSTATRITVSTTCLAA